MNSIIRLATPSDNSAVLKGMTFPTYQEHIEPACQGDSGLLAIVAEAQGGPIGLALGSIYNDPGGCEKESTMMSVFVEPSSRSQGIGTALVEGFLKMAVERGVQKVSVLFMEGKPGTATLERILARTGWGQPEGRMVAIKQRAVDALHEDYGWCRALPDPGGARVIPWADVSEEQKEGIRIWQNESGEIPVYLCPDEVTSQTPVHLGTSVALEVDGRVLGWVLTHPLEGGTLRFTASYVKRDMQRRALLLNLLYASVSKMEECGFPSGIWTVPAQDVRMYRFALRRIAPHSDYCRETKISIWRPLDIKV
jgi:GNAT superfamily N-acetyltransferase